MAIQVSCPQCQTSFTLPDASRGKQVRCKECFQVFHSGGEPADAAAEPPPAPAPTSRPAVKPMSNLAAKPAPARPAAAKPAAKPAAVQKKAAPAVKRPQPVNALDFSAADEHPTTSKHRRRRGWGGVIAVLVLFFLLVLGGGAAAVGVLAYQGKLPSQLAALLPINAPQAAAKPADAPPPDKDGAPAPPKADKPEVPKPDKPDAPKPDNSHSPKPLDKAPPPKPDQPAEPPAAKAPPLPPPDKNPPPPPDRPAGAPSQENYNKIAMGMSLEDVRKLLGQEARKLPTPGGQEIYEWGNGVQSIAVGIVSNGGGVYTKSTGWDWPLVWPGDAAVKPPTPDKPAGQMNRATFDKIAKGMSLDDLVALVGKPTNTNKIDPAFNAGVDTHLAWLVFGANTGVDLFEGKVVNKVNFQSWPLVWPGDAAVKPPSPPDKAPGALTKDLFDKIANGMTVEEVTALLGQPHGSQKMVGFVEGAYTVVVLMVWASAPDSPAATVMFSKGKVVSKVMTEKWPGDRLTVTKENFDKIEKGMSKDALTALLGPPTQDTGLQPGFTYADLIWQGFGIRITVSMDGGKAHSKDILQPNWLTKENFDKIAKGMSEKDVIDLVGPPKYNPENPAAAAGGDNLALAWFGPTSQFTSVTFVKGKVTEKKTTENWPIVYPGEAAAPPGDVAVKPPPPPAGLDAVVSRAQQLFNKVAKGMSKDDVVKLLGPATDESLVVDPKGVKVAFLKWKYGIIPTAFEVVLNDDKVVDKSNEQNWPVVYPGDAAVKPPPGPDKIPAPPAPKAVELTKDLFDKIAKGMNKDALTALLGPPTQVQANPQPGVEERLIWTSPGTRIMVSMAGGKTLFKFTTQDWPVVYP